RHIRT
ncbi:hypothetical protein D043_3697B, partial [Vibrio parahaemolyticus EKP-021]